MISYVFVDSSNRTPQNGNVYTLNLTSPLKNIYKVDLVLANVPNTLYNVVNGVITINSIDSSIPDGFYDTNGLIKYLNAILPGVGVDYLNNEGKFIFYSNQPFTMTVSSTLQKVLGYPSNTSTTTTSVYTNLYKNSSIIVSTKVIDLSTSNFVFLDIEELRNSRVIDSKSITVNDTYEGSTVARSFAGIPLDVPVSSIKTFKETSDYKYSIQFDSVIPSLDRLTIRWIDKLGNIISFHGNEQNSFLLRFYCSDYAPPQEEKESREEELLRKIERTLQDTIPPPKKESGPPRIVFVGIILALLVIIYFLFKSRTTQVVQQPLNLSQTNLRPQVLQTRIHSSL